MKSRITSVMQLLAGRENDLSQVDWADLYTVFKSNGLTPWIFNEYQGAMEDTCRPLYENDYVLNALINEALLREAARLETVFEESVIRIKGSALSSLLYDGQPTRVFYDVDFLVKRDRLGAVIEHLLVNGYRKSPIVEWAGTRNRVNFFKEIGPKVEMNLDLHTELFWEANSEVMWRTNREEKGFWLLAHEDHFFYLIVNWSYQDTYVGLNKFLDLALFWRKFGGSLDQERIVYLIKKHRLDRVFQIVFTLMEAFFGLNLDGIKRRLDFAPAWLLQLPDAGFMVSPYSSLFKYFLLKHVSKSNLIQALRYDVGWGCARIKNLLSG